VALLYLGRRFAKRVIVGDIFLLYFIWYGAERFGLEFLRTGNWKVGAIPAAQIVGIIFVVASVGLLMWRHMRNHTKGLPAAGVPAREVSHSAERRRRRRPGTQNDG
jgi:prolipoprotein diacylglyceryltransferase